NPRRGIIAAVAFLSSDSFRCHRKSEGAFGKRSCLSNRQSASPNLAKGSIIYFCCTPTDVFGNAPPETGSAYSFAKRHPRICAHIHTGRHEARDDAGSARESVPKAKGRSIRCRYYPAYHRWNRPAQMWVSLRSVHD